MESNNYLFKSISIIIMYLKFITDVLRRMTGAKNKTKATPNLQASVSVF